MRPAVLFDLGNTLAAYYHPEDFRPILDAAITDVWRELTSRALSHVPLDTALTAAIAENREASDFRFTPMAERFERIFEVPLAEEPALAERLCHLFLRRIFAIGRVYEDSLAVLRWLRRAGHPIGIVSNAPWGSPPDMWRTELERLGLASVVDTVVLCGDVGWRKPARAIFEFAATAVDRRPERCIFVGDDLRWDISGSKSTGMRPVLIDRGHRYSEYAGERIEDLRELTSIVDASA